MSDTDESVCPGCREKFADDAITGVLSSPESGNGPKRRWHLHCHQTAYSRAMDRQMRLAAEAADRKYGGL